MDNLNKFGLACVVMALFVAGCGKKHTNTTPTQQSNKQVVANNEIPLLKDEVEDLLEDSDISDFAFIDDEQDEKFEDISFDSTSVTAYNSSLSEGIKAEELLENEENDDISSFSFKTVQFDLNKNSIRPDQKPIVQEDIQVAQDAVAQGKQVVVEGHCCQTGSATYNLALSQRRAETVKSEMVKHGLNPEDIKTVGYGYERPIVWSDAQDHAQYVKEIAPNRRAEILVN